MATKVVADKYLPGSDGGTSGSFNTTGANIIYVFVNWLAGQAEPVLSDTQGGLHNTYTAGVLLSCTNYNSRAYRCVNPPHVGSGHTFTLTGTGNFPGIAFIALQGGLSTQYDIGKNSHALSDVGFGATSLKPGSLTPSANNAICVTGLGTISTGAKTISVATGFTVEVDAPNVGGTSLGIGLAWKNVATAAAQDPQWNWSANVLDESTADMMVFLESVPGAFTFIDLVAGEVIPHLQGQIYATVPHSGTYDQAGTTPVTIERQLYKADGTTVLQAWTALSGTSISGGTWSGTINTQEGGSAGYLMNFRIKDGGGSIITTGTLSTHHWSVGEVDTQISSQSHVSHQEDFTAGTPPTPNVAGRVLWADGTWRSPVGNGNCAYVNAYIAGRAGTGLGGTDPGFGIVRGGIGGAGNTLDGGSATPFSDERDYYYSGGEWNVTVGASKPFVKWKIVEALLKGNATWYRSLGGSSDAIFDVTTAVNYAAQNTIRGNADAFLVVSANSIPLMACINARTASTTYTDAEWRTCVQADRQTQENRTNVYYGACLIDLALDDDFHLSPGPTGYERVAKRDAQTALFIGGHVSYDGGNCRIISAKRLYGAHDIYVVVSAPGATALKNSAGSTTSGALTGWAVYATDGVTPLTITATSFVGMGVKITVSETMANSDNITVKYLDGRNPTITNIVYDDTSPGGDSIGRPLIPTIDTVVVTARPRSRRAGLQGCG